MKFKSFDSVENLLAATKIVIDHMKWVDAVMADTYDWCTEEELAADEAYQERVREPMIVKAIVENFTAEKIISLHNEKLFVLKICQVAKKFGFGGFDSVVDGFSKKTPSIVKIYNEISGGIEKSAIFSCAHTLTKMNLAAVGDYRVALSFYLKMLNGLVFEKKSSAKAFEQKIQCAKTSIECLVGKKAGFDFGTRSLTITVTSINTWRSGAMVRNYIDFDIAGGANPLRKFYEIVEGATRDDVIEIDGRKFGYELGFCDSKTKRASVRDAIITLLSAI